MKTKLTILLTILTIVNTAVFAADNWNAKLQKELPLLGHRNWIVVADSAYPGSTLTQQA